MTKSKDPTELVHWADNVVRRVISAKGDKPKYTVAAGITPSGTIHIGNFREIITVELVARAFKDAGKNVRFIYSWDDYDVFRKVPKNMPQKDMLEKYLRMPIVDIPDPFETEESYARHHEVELEISLSVVGIVPEYLYQSKKYRDLEYVKGIKNALEKKDKIREILDEHRKEPLSESWLPLSGYDPDTNTDDITFLGYDGEDILEIKTANQDSERIDINKLPFLKLPWRIDWPMRWAHEKVDFEPGGKDHSTIGGSFTTAKEIVKLFGWEAPVYQMYDFISIKGTDGKISSSKGDVITLKDCLDIYEPAMVRWLFARTRPNTEFAISFDLDVVKNYEDFDRCERIYYRKQEVKEKEYVKQKRIYELSCISKPQTNMPFQPSFRHLTTILLINSFDIEKTVKTYENEFRDDADRQRVRERALRAKNWIEKYAPEEFSFSINDEIPANLVIEEEMKEAILELRESLRDEKWDALGLHNNF